MHAKHAQGVHTPLELLILACNLALELVAPCGGARELSILRVDSERAVGTCEPSAGCQACGVEAALQAIEPRRIDRRDRTLEQLEQLLDDGAERLSSLAEHELRHFLYG